MQALPQLPLALGLAMVASSLVGALVLLVRRRRRAAAAVAADATDTQPAESGAEPAPVSEDEDRVEGQVEGRVESQDRDEVEPTSVAVRTLRAQVRVLEEALARSADAVPARVAAPEAGLAAYRRQVRSAVQAVAQGADESTRYAVARVAAAIERLDTPEAFERPVLPAVRERTERVEPRSGLVAVAPLVETEPVPESEPATAPAPTAAADAPQVPPPAPVPETELVLPVPPPAPAATRRGRRRLRHPAA